MPSPAKREVHPVLGSVGEILVRGQERQIVPDGELCKQRIDGSDLNTCLAARISQRSGADVVVSIRLGKRQ